MNLPNWITLSRLALTVPFLVLAEMVGFERWALALFLVASLTDWVDGYLARKLNQISVFGKLMDPLCDKVLVAGGLVALAAKGFLPAWSVTAILFREFLVTGLRSLEAAEGVIVPAGWLGKVKTVVQMAAISLVFLGAGGSEPWAAPALDAGLWIYWVAVALTIASGAEYAWAARRLIFKGA